MKLVHIFADGCFAWSHPTLQIVIAAGMASDASSQKLTQYQIVKNNIDNIKFLLNYHKKSGNSQEKLI